MEAIATPHAQALWRDLAGRISQLMTSRGAHPARTVVLLPYFQLVPVARRAWAERQQGGFAPRFETTRNWAAAGVFEPGELDFSGDAGRDLLVARSLLVRAGMSARADALAGRVVEAAQQLAPLAAAVAPAERAQWAASARAAVTQGMDAEALQLEALVARVAVEWVAASSFATDALLGAGTLDSVELLVILQGAGPEPLDRAFALLAPDKTVTVSLVAEAPRGTVALHAAKDGADEAERAAACVLRHVAAGRVPVALAATDRVLTRRIAAHLARRNVRMRDEQGWKLSTTRSAAQVMSLLKACAWDAPADHVLEWLKQAPGASAGLVLALERNARRAGLREWRMLRPEDCGESNPARELLARVNAWRESLHASRALTKWIADLGVVLRESGQFSQLAADDAGGQVLDALRLGVGGDEDLQGLSAVRGRLSATEFRTWVDEVLEAESFRPAADADAHVVVLPFTQTLARPFAAIVLPGCDEQRLPASPELTGPWTPLQRESLQLQTRAGAEEAQRTAWRQALQVAHCDVLWRTADDGGETLLPSPLVQELLLLGTPLATDPRESRELVAAPVTRPEAIGAELPFGELSASAYEDLRRCPYRFFALRQLGLREVDELDAEVGKRDFGNWVHAVLARFHEQMRDGGEPAEGRRALLDEAAAHELRALRVHDGEFLPFEAGWPAVRDAYLGWLEQHERKQARFVAAESWHRATVGDYKLAGVIDRIDETPTGRLVIDYKTERLAVTQQRVKERGEDTQLAFYAALLDSDDVEAAYLNIDERGNVKQVPHPDILATRDAMRDAIASELGRIAAGAALPALGEGRACEYCAARGICRKDWW